MTKSPLCIILPFLLLAGGCLNRSYYEVQLKRPNPLGNTYSQAEKRPEKEAVSVYQLTDQVGNRYQIAKKYVTAVRPPASDGSDQFKLPWDVILSEDNPYGVPLARSMDEPRLVTKTLYRWTTDSGKTIEVPEMYVLGITRKKREQSKSFSENPFRGDFEFRN